MLGLGAVSQLAISAIPDAVTTEDVHPKAGIVVLYKKKEKRKRKREALVKVIPQIQEEPPRADVTELVKALVKEPEPTIDLRGLEELKALEAQALLDALEAARKKAQFEEDFFLINHLILVSEEEDD